MIEAGLFNLLSNTQAITSICGTRIYPDVFPPSGEYPAIACRLIGNKPGPTLDTSGMQRLRVEFECRAADSPTAAGLRKALIETLEGYRGTLSDGTYLQDGQQIQIMSDYVNDPRLYVRSVEFYLFFNFGS